MNNYKAESDNALKEKPYIVFDKKEDGGEIRLALGDENNLRVTRVYAVDGDGAVIYDRQVPVKEAFGEAYKRIEGNYYDYMRHNYRYFALAEAANACAAIGDHEAVNKILGMVQDEKKSFDRKVYEPRYECLQGLTTSSSARAEAPAFRHGEEARRARGRKPLPSGMGRKLAPHRNPQVPKPERRRNGEWQKMKPDEYERARSLICKSFGNYCEYCPLYDVDNCHEQTDEAEKILLKIFGICPKGYEEAEKEECRSDAAAKYRVDTLI